MVGLAAKGDRRVTHRDIDPAIGVRRLGELAAIFTIGDGLLGLVQPDRHVDLWRSRRPALDLLVRPFAEQSRRRRLYGAIQIAAGLMLAARLRRRSLADI